MAAVLDMPLHLTEDELQSMTGYRRPSKQMEVLRSLGIPARLRPDHSVLVMRMHCMSREAAEAANAPIKRQPRVK